MYHLFTQRLVLTLSHPKLTKEVCRFHNENKAAFAGTEPCRPDSFYTLNGVKDNLRYDDKLSRKCEEFRFWITEKGSDEIIGTVCIASILFGSVKSCFLSYKVAEKHQGKGYATEAVNEVCRFAFTILQLHRIESYVMPRNIKSCRVMEKLGFEKEGVSRRCLEVNGVWEDHIRFSLLNE